MFEVSNSVMERGLSNYRYASVNLRTNENLSLLGQPFNVIYEKTTNVG